MGFGALFALFLFQNEAQAEVIVFDNGYTGTGGGSWNTANGFLKYTPNANVVITKIEEDIAGNDYSYSSTTQVAIWSFVSSSNPIAGSVLATGTFTDLPHNTPEKREATLNNSVSISAGNSVWIQTNSGFGYFEFGGYATHTTEISDFYYCFSDDSCLGPQGGGYVSYLKMSGYSSAIPEISIIRPVNATTTTNDAYFGLFWGFDILAGDEALCSDENPCEILVNYYGTNLTTPIYGDYFTLNTTSSIQIYRAKNFLLDYGDYSAQAFLYDDMNQTTLLASSTAITFTIATSTPPTGLENICEDASWYWKPFCNIMIFLFKPSQTSFDSIQTIKDRIIYKPPIGYFTIIKDKISNLSVGTSTYAILDASTTEAFSGIFSPIRTGFIWILWLLFGFWVLNRLRHLEI